MPKVSDPKICYAELQGLQQQPAAQQPPLASAQPSASAQFRPASAQPADPRAAAMKAPSPPPGPPPGDPGTLPGVKMEGPGRGGTPPVASQVKLEARVSLLQKAPAETQQHVKCKLA